MMRLDDAYNLLTIHHQFNLEHYNWEGLHDHLKSTKRKSTL